MRKQDRVAAVVFILIGIAVIIYSMTGLDLGSIKTPGPGVFPFICGSIMIVFSIAWWYLASKEKDIDHAPFWEKGVWVKPLHAVILICLYAGGMEILGYIAATFAFIIAWQLILEREKIVKTLVMAVIGSVFMFTLFTFLLSVPLPKGIFNI